MQVAFSLKQKWPKMLDKATLEIESYMDMNTASNMEVTD